MEEDDEMHSHPSPPATGSPSPLSQSPPNERISVTVAAAAPPTQQQQQHNSIIVAPPPPQRNGGGGGREDCWSEGATAVLIDAWGERYLELSRGNLKQKHWKEVADIVSSREDYTKTPKTDIQCKNRIDTVKKKYKLEKAKIMSGGGASKWVFFDKLDQLIGPTAKIPVPLAASPAIAPPAAGSSRVPMGIPVGIRTPTVAAVKNQHQIHLRKRSGGGSGMAAAVDTESDESEEESRDSMDSFPPAKRIRVAVDLGKGKKEKGGWGESVRMLTQAVLKFGEAYEQAESAKLQQVVEMERQRMKFAKELELQRMQFFMKTQLEISQLKHGRRTGNVSNHNRNNSSNNNNDNNSDCSI
ncbi:trihelix transcription factor ASIL2-like [Mangifera indica]|uniref:trihelix transcription factor ASIL2-like n=1 Tax=Mangifera indica TaxID=29780 RepID=UPI001CFB4A15|nr:trihelix transcription factor ASIL2-like [Mangifera indica]